MRRRIIIGICSALCVALLVMTAGCITINPKPDSASSSSSGSSSSSSSSASGSSTSGSTGSSSTGSSTSTSSAWPDNAHTAGVPQPQFAANVTLTLNESIFFSITYSGVAASDAATYLQQLKDAGFTKVESNTDIVGTTSYNATNPNSRQHLSFTYASTSKTMTVALNHY